MNCTPETFWRIWHTQNAIAPPPPSVELNATAGVIDEDDNSECLADESAVIAAASTPCPSVATDVSPVASVRRRSHRNESIPASSAQGDVTCTAHYADMHLAVAVPDTGQPHRLMA